MRKIIYTNTKGESVEIGAKEPYLLNSFDGLGDVEANNQSQRAPYQDGSTPIDTLLDERVISFTLTILASSPDELPRLRQLLTRIFNPKLGEGTLIYEDDYQIKMIKGKADSIPTFPSGNGNRTPITQRSSISLTCSDPYWKEPQEFSRALKAYEGKFTFPFSFPVQFGIEGDVTTLLNDGDTNAPAIISIKGPITKPMIENRTTGEFIQVNTSITSDEVLYIDTTPRHKRVEIHRDNQIINAMGYLDHNSDFWKLGVGENDIRFTAYEGIESAIAAISWQNRYVGI